MYTFFFFNDTATTEIYPLSLHDALPIFAGYGWNVAHVTDANDLEMLGRAYENFLQTNDRPTLIIVNSHIGYGSPHKRSEEHTSELQSQSNLVCRLLLEKKNTRVCDTRTQ